MFTRTVENKWKREDGRDRKAKEQSKEVKEKANSTNCSDSRKGKWHVRKTNRERQQTWGQAETDTIKDGDRYKRHRQTWAEKMTRKRQKEANEGRLGCVGKKLDNSSLVVYTECIIYYLDGNRNNGLSPSTENSAHAPPKFALTTCSSHSPLYHCLS